MAKKHKEQVLREVKLTDATKVVISSFLNDEGEAFINLRKFYKKKSAEEWMPDRQGIVIRAAKGKKVIKTMIECYQNIEEEAVPLPPKEDKAKGKKKKVKDENDE
jgi:hypothetical protein